MLQTKKTCKPSSPTLSSIAVKGLYCLCSYWDVTDVYTFLGSFLAWNSNDHSSFDSFLRQIGIGYTKWNLGHKLFLNYSTWMNGRFSCWYLYILEIYGKIWQKMVDIKISPKECAVLVWNVSVQLSFKDEFMLSWRLKAGVFTCTVKTIRSIRNN